jgi:hypothetical protein
MRRELTIMNACFLEVDCSIVATNVPDDMLQVCYGTINFMASERLIALCSEICCRNASTLATAALKLLSVA